jgi:hypothetical protein
MRALELVSGLLVLAVLVNGCLGEFTHSQLLETPQAGNDPVALLSSLASLSTSGLVYGAASWERDASSGAAAAAVHSAADNSHVRAGQWSEGQPQQPAEQPLKPPHKALFPLGTRDLATLLLTIITLFIAAGGGIGGGAVFIVCYVFVGGEPNHTRHTPAMRSCTCKHTTQLVSAHSDPFISIDCW